VQFLDPVTNTTVPEASLLTGNLNLGVSPPVWTPNQDVAAFNLTGTTVDEYQLSISQDGLTAVWDRYQATTYPNNATGNSFCCRRASTAVPFAGASICAISGVGAGGVDPHIGEELTNGHVILYHIDFLSTTPNIVKGDLNPLTGALGPTTVVAAWTAAGGFNHSPFVMRDSTGKARALCYSEYPGLPQHSNVYFSEGVDNDGTPEVIIDGLVPAPEWYNNPGLVGGTWHYCTSGRTEPQLQEVSMLANCDLTSGSGRIVAWAPVRPLPGSGVYISIVGIGQMVPPGLEYQVPPVLGNLHILLTVGITPIAFHDQYGGGAEWLFSNVPPLFTTFDMQLITLDSAAGTISASNTAVVRL